MGMTESARSVQQPLIYYNMEHKSASSEGSKLLSTVLLSLAFCFNLNILHTVIEEAL